jgi:hypothetical protein
LRPQERAASEPESDAPTPNQSASGSATDAAVESSEQVAPSATDAAAEAAQPDTSPADIPQQAQSSATSSVENEQRGAANEPYQSAPQRNVSTDAGEPQTNAAVGQDVARGQGNDGAAATTADTTAPRQNETSPSPPSAASASGKPPSPSGVPQQSAPPQRSARPTKRTGFKARNAAADTFVPYSLEVPDGLTPVQRAEARIRWVKENANMDPPARAYNNSAPGFRPGLAPALMRKLPGGRIRPVKFDGMENGFLIDRKTGVRRTLKFKQGVRRQSDALTQNGLTGRWHVPDEATAKEARRLLERLGIENIEVEVRP